MHAFAVAAQRGRSSSPRYGMHTASHTTLLLYQHDRLRSIYSSYFKIKFNHELNAHAFPLNHCPLATIQPRAADLI